MTPDETDISSLIPRDRTALRPQEIAKILDCSISHIVNLIESGELGAVDLGTRSARHIRIPVSAYTDWLRTRDTRKTPTSHIRPTAR